MKNKLVHRAALAGLASVTIIGGAIVGVGVSAALADPKGAPVAPDYSENARGQSFGSALEAPTPETEPDLIKAIGDDSKTEGYVKKTDLDADTTFANPAEAAAETRASLGETRTVPLYAVDGMTEIGTFTIQPPTPQ
jgi:hypothetical protein